MNKGKLHWEKLSIELICQDNIKIQHHLKKQAKERGAENKSQTK